MTALSESVNELKTNPRQWDAFTSSGHCVVVAPPGSGKTKLLTTRLAFDLVNKISGPHGAACITLTNAATEELRRRVEQLGVEDRANLFIGTVHSFALARVIAPFASLIGRPELAHLSIANSQQCSLAYQEAIAEVFRPGDDIRSVRSTIEFNRQRLATEEDWARSGERVRAVAQRYKTKLRAQGLHDFLDVVEIGVELVEHHMVIRRVLTAQYPHLYVDEYQDLAPGLDRLVRALCFDYLVSSELFAVGDPDQALFAFTGTRPELLDELAARSDVTPVRLDHNYRCGEAIIRVANLMRRGRSPITGDRPGGTVEAVTCPGGFADQCRQVVLYVRKAEQRGVPLHEVAVICPMNSQCEDVTATLRAAGIPAFARGSEYRLTPVTAFIEGCAAWATLGRECSNYRLGELLRRWRTTLGARWSRSDDVALTDTLMSYRERGEELAHQLVAELLDRGLRRALEQVVWADDSVEVALMVKALTSGDLRKLSVRDLAERARRVDRVEVTTMTSSKGLEFDVVMIMGADEDSIPHYLSVNDPSKLAEDRRKFYVSVTRGRDEVRFFYSGFVVTRYGRKIYKGPSRFLREIGLVS
jgi:DNA helicase-2/ATP-dependent DNA helicase PcrA